MEVLQNLGNPTPQPQSTEDDILSWLGYADDTGANFLRGAREGVSNLAGMPVDLVNASPMLGNILPGEQGFEPISEYPFLGSEMIDDAMGGFGALPEPPEPVDMWQRGARRVGEELGATAVPAAGILAQAGRVGVQGARQGGQLSRMFVEPAAVDPGRFVARETAAATAAGSGAAVANELAPDSQWADIIGALGGAGAARGRIESRHARRKYRQGGLRIEELCGRHRA